MIDTLFQKIGEKNSYRVYSDFEILLAGRSYYLASTLGYNYLALSYYPVYYVGYNYNCYNVIHYNAVIATIKKFEDPFVHNSKYVVISHL